MLTIVPMTITNAKAFVARHHRHNKPPVSGLFAVGCAEGDVVHGVAVAGRPVARKLDDGQTVEVTRVCTDGARNACSMLYGAIRRAALALGYARLYTYTLPDEGGASLRASGWTEDATVTPPKTWNSKSKIRIQTDLFGNESRPSGPKTRWVYPAAPQEETTT